MEKNRKAQAAMDLLLTYSWVLVVIIGILGALVATGVFDIGFLQQNKCEARHPINCQQITITQSPLGTNVDTVLHNLGANKLNVSNLIFTDDEGNTCDSGTMSNTLDTAKEIQIKFDCTNDLTSGKIKITYTNLNSKSGIQELSTGEYKINKKQYNDNPYDSLSLSSGGETIVFKIVDNSTSISSTNPIIIPTAQELSNIRHTLTDTSYTHFKLANNIDLTEFDTDTDTSNGNWAPIGSFSTPFNGSSFDGGGFSITGLDISVSSDYVGLFGFVNNSNISNVSVAGSVVSTGNRVGGLIGTVDNTNVSFASFSGSVSGNWHVGGLIGRADEDLNVSSSSSSGTVTGTSDNVAGLVGLLEDSTVSDSFSSSNVNGRKRVGGLVGYLFQSNNGISNSFSFGVVVGSGGGEIGGLVGLKYNSNCVASYWDTQTSGQANSVCGAVGKTTSQLQTPTGPRADVYVNWDADIWDFGTSAEYPTLRGVG